MYRLQHTDVKYLPGVGPKRAEVLGRELNIRTFAVNRERLDTIIAIYEEKIADPKMLELLSRTEHRRWTAYMAVNGWIILPKESLVEWMKNNKGSHKDYLRLRHACMAGWEELDELSLIKTNGKDADVFKESDRRMVKGVKHFVV